MGTEKTRTSATPEKICEGPHTASTSSSGTRDMSKTEELRVLGCGKHTHCGSLPQLETQDQQHRAAMPFRVERLGLQRQTVFLSG